MQQGLSSNEGSSKGVLGSEDKRTHVKKDNKMKGVMNVNINKYKRKRV